MNPALITAAVSGFSALIEVYHRWSALREKHQKGLAITPADIDALYAPFENKTYDDYLAEARKKAE